MSGYLIVGLFIVGFISLILVIFLIKNHLRRLEFKDWEINDSIILDDWSLSNKLKQNGRTYAKVKGWNVNNIFIDLGDGMITQITWDKIDTNKSALWRRNVKDCESDMGKKPGFSGIVRDFGIEDNNTIGDTIDGKPIILLSEVECQAYLKQAIDNEDYDMAEKIRKQMEKFR